MDSAVSKNEVFALYKYIRVDESDVITFDKFKECISQGIRN